MVSVILGGVLAGCSGGNGNTPATNNGNATEANGGSSSGENMQPLTLSFYSEDPNPNWSNMEDEVGQVITEKTGITLDAEFAVGDPVQKSALIAASGDYPDLISAKGSINKFVDAGAVLDLTELIDEHAPNIKKLYGEELKRARYSSEDPAIYALPTYSGVGHTSFNAGGGFELQHRVVKELGYPEIRTVKDFENAIKTYLEKHKADENGVPNIGLTLNADDWRMYISVTDPAPMATGAPGDGEYFIDFETQDVTYHFRRPVEKEYFRWLNHMNAEGLLDRESFVQKYDQYKAKVASGRVLGLIDQDWNYGDGEKALKAEGKFDQGYGHYPVTLSEEYKDTSFWPTGFLGGYGIAISATNPDPVRTIQFLDYLASDEGQVLMNWGIEGKHYEVVDGKRTIPQEVNDRKINDAASFQKQTGIGHYLNLAPHYGDGVKDPSGNYYTTQFPEQIVKDFNEVEKEVLTAYKATTWKDLFPKEDEFPVRPWGAAWNIPVPGDSEIVILDEKLKTITWKRIPEVILSNPADFDKLWADYMAELEDAGVEKAEELRKELVQERVEMWK
ncbi:ABC transporter substrate-binding protein [Paenibacillus phyllosphaerae]|nr:ABC transporter substrate-binding protein [Paenibacillus phyllosphaerae]